MIKPLGTIMLINEGVESNKLKDHDVVTIKNPTEEDFSWKFGGEMYGIKTGEVKGFSKFVAFHLAKHLSSKMITSELEKTMTKKQRENRNDAIHYDISQLNIYDTHQRRIALYKILESKELVEKVMTSYPFKGFIGDMSLYEDFVSKSTAPQE